MQNSSTLAQSPLTLSEVGVRTDAQKVSLLNTAVRNFISGYAPEYQSSSLLNKIVRGLQRSSLPFHYMNPPLWQLALRMLAQKQRVTPDFACTGAVRSGEDLLAHYVMQHPCVALPLSKEFFPAPIYTDRFIRAQLPSQRQYDALEEKWGVARAGMFSSIQPSDSWVYWSKALNPDLKFVITLRNPVDRVISHWNWNRMISSSVVTDPLWDLMPGFKKAMDIEMEQIPAAGCGFHFHCGVGATSYLRHSIYLPFIRKLHEEFGNESVLIVDSDNLFGSPVETMQKVYDFLGLPDYVAKPAETSCDIPEAYRDRVEEDQVREPLGNFFKPYNEALFEYLGQEFNWESAQKSYEETLKDTNSSYEEPELLELVG